jgi:hypothetical protein
MQRHNHRNRKNQKKREKDRKDKREASSTDREMLDAQNTRASEQDIRFGGKTLRAFVHIPKPHFG